MVILFSIILIWQIWSSYKLLPCLCTSLKSSNPILLCLTQHFLRPNLSFFFFFMHMTTLHSSSSAAESTMEDPSNHHHHHGQNRPKKHHHHPSTPTPTVSTTTGESDGEVEEAEDGDPEVWATFNKSFRQVQSVLDRNRLLIQQVNENQQSRIHDNMVKNVSLIQELNGNISKVVSLYSDLNSNFTNMCQQRSKNSSSRCDK